MRLGERAWPAVDPAATVVLVPVGATEQHGPHLPLDTDTRIAEAVALRSATRRPDLLVAPALAYGSSGEHAGFPGTLSVGQTALELVLVELVRSADPFRGVVLVHGHGGNAEPVARAVRRLEAEGRPVLSWWPTHRPGDLHAGRTETSVLLALAPGLVGPDRPVGPVPALDDLRRGGVAALSPTGVLGDPTGASAAEGAALLEGWVAALLDAIGRRWPADPSMSSSTG